MVGFAGHESDPYLDDNPVLEPAFVSLLAHGFRGVRTVSVGGPELASLSNR